MGEVKGRGNILILIYLMLTGYLLMKTNTIYKTPLYNGKSAYNLTSGEDKYMIYLTSK